MAQIVAGLDFGNKNCVIAIPQNGGVDVVTNSSSKRLTPTIVGYGDDRRYAGDIAQNHQMQHINSTISELKRLVGLKYATQEREELSKIVPFELAELEDGFTGVRINGVIMRPEQHMAFLFKQLLELAKKQDNRVDGFVIAVSPWWTELHRRSILDAASIANIEIVALVNSTTAAAITYAVNHRSKLPEDTEEPVNVMFIDFGDSSMNVCICKITKNKVTVSSFAGDKNFGGSHFTDALYLYLVDKVKSKFNVDPTANPRAQLRFRTAVENAKKNLSINPIVNFELIDNDISFTIKREEFESQIGDLIKRIAAPVEAALELAKITKEDLFATEVLGGASRVPAVKTEIQRILGKEATQSLNLDECFAVGSGYFSAILSPSFRIAIEVHDVAPHAVRCSWQDASGSKKCTLFQQFSKVPSQVSKIPLSLNDKTEITFFDEEGPIGVAKVNMDPCEEPKKVCLRARMTQSSTVEVLNAVLVDDTEVPVTFERVLGLSASQIEEFKKKEHEMAAKDLAEMEIDNTRNELESLVFKTENAITRDFPECFDPEKIETAKSVVEKVREWFDEHEFDRFSATEYRKRITELQAVTSEAFQRHKLFKKILDYEDQIVSRLAGIKEKFCAMKCKELAEKEHEFEEFSNKLMQDLDKVRSLPRHETPEFNLETVRTDISSWESFMEQTEEEMKKKSKGWCNVA